MEVLTVDEFYKAADSQGKLLGLKCENGHITAPPRHTCSACGSAILSISELSRRGRIISYTEVFVKSREFPVETPFVFVLAKLEEGPNLLGVLVDSQGKFSNTASSGANVVVKFSKIPSNLSSENKWPRVFFELAEKTS
jgi:uncharacterized OB-fold protein